MQHRGVELVMDIEYIRTMLPHLSLEYFESVDSTNTYLKDHIGELSDRTVALTTMQTHGKGRLGRSWLSNPMESLCMSILIKNVRMDYMLLLPALCAVAQIRALENQGIEKVGIKWPNDIVLNGKKVSGILCESCFKNKNEISVVCGIGINVKQPLGAFKIKGLEYADSIYSITGIKVSMETLVIDIVLGVEKLYELLCRNGFSALYNEYVSKSLSVGKDVRVIIKGESVVGRAIAINVKGELVCNINGKLVSVNSGEASVRGLYGYV